MTMQTGTYIDAADTVFLLSVKDARRITTSEELVGLRALAMQGMAHLGVTLKRGKQQERFTIPTARLTEYGRVVLRYMEDTVDSADWVDMTAKANEMTKRSVAHVAAV